MHYLPFMAAITLPPLVGRGDEGRSVEVVGGIEGETQPAEGWWWELQHISEGWGGVRTQKVCLWSFTAHLV